MRIERKPKFERMRRDGFAVSLDKPLDAGRILHVVGIKQAADALTDLAALSKYSQIAIHAKCSPHTLYIGVAQLIESPQVTVGFHHTGLPLVLELQALQGHITILGPTRRVRMS